MNEDPKYTVEGHRKATTSMSIRTLVSLYLVYLGWSVARSSTGADGSLKPWMGWGVFVVFTAVAAAFAVYTHRQYKRDLKAAEVHEEDKAPEEEAEEDEDEDEDGDGPAEP